VDTAVRAVTLALTRPVQKISGLAAGIAHGLASLRVRKSPRAAYATARDAAQRREAEIADELRREGGTRGG
jgi:predicted transcriptional regulator